MTRSSVDWQAKTKICTGCKTRKSFDEFQKNRSMTDGLQSQCRLCCNARPARANPETVKAYYRQNADRLRAVAVAGNRLRKYGLTTDAFLAKVAAQDGLCAGCGQEMKPGRDTNIDHDHKTGAMRDLLCGGCNLILGHADDDPERLLALVAYLMRWA